MPTFGKLHRMILSHWYTDCVTHNKTSGRFTTILPWPDPVYSFWLVRWMNFSHKTSDVPMILRVVFAWKIRIPVCLCSEVSLTYPSTASPELKKHMKYFTIHILLGSEMTKVRLQKINSLNQLILSIKDTIFLLILQFANTLMSTNRIEPTVY